MANYKETTIAGQSYVRACRVVAENPKDGGAAITFIEEKVVNIEGEAAIVMPAGSVVEPFTPENAGEQFAIRNPLTGEDTGQSATYQDVYVLLHSLYYHVAQKRDAAAAELINS